MSAERTSTASGSATSGPLIKLSAGNRFSPLAEIWFSTSTRNTLETPTLGAGSAALPPTLAQLPCGGSEASAMLPLEVLHVLHQRSHPFYRHGVVDRSAHAAHQPVALELD